MFLVHLPSAAPVSTSHVGARELSLLRRSSCGKFKELSKAWQLTSPFFHLDDDDRNGRTAQQRVLRQVMGEQCLRREAGIRATREVGIAFFVRHSPVLYNYQEKMCCAGHRKSLVAIGITP